MSRTHDGGRPASARPSSAADPSFLADLPARPVTLPPRSPFHPLGLHLGQGASALEVLVATAEIAPAATALRSAWKARKGGRAAPVLFVVLYRDEAALCGPAGEDAPAHVGLDTGQVERICREALGAPDRHAALRALRDSLPAVESELAGVRNEGFLATHELAAGARERADWSRANAKARSLLGRSGRALLEGLGFGIERCDRVTSILRSADRKIAVAVLLERDESPELASGRFSDLSPTSYALAVADRENLPYVVVQHGAKVRIHPTRVGVGVGRRGRTETYLECHAGLLRDRDAAYLWLLCSADALAPGGTLEQLLEASGRFSGDLAEKLRERIYRSVVPLLAQGIVSARGVREPSAQDLADTYEMALTVLFRLLFVAYAEDKDLLPFRWNGLYRRRSLKTKARELAELARAGTPFDEGDGLWVEMTRLFRAVDRGNREWGVPAYDGGLFSEDPDVSRAGELLAGITLPNEILGPALRDLLLVDTAEGLGPVDFRSLGVREFGTIYEGLLESELSVAGADLTVDRAGVYLPCKRGEESVVQRGTVYLHNASGARKSTGSYFTKPFAVEHLLERALEPALAAHLERLDALDEAAAGMGFFDFRVADIAMGSGHFLVAAIDHIERGLSGYLSRRPLPVVAEDLVALRAASRESLGALADQVEIEDTQLLRRLIARRCIYGVDINPTSVQLARLAIWIHTFAPGLPLSFLDHNLAQGNSLVGIAQTSEIVRRLVEEKLAGWIGDPQDFLRGAAEPLDRLRRLLDSDTRDVARARKAWAEARAKVAPLEALCDVMTSTRVEGRVLFERPNTRWKDDPTLIMETPEYRRVAESLGDLKPFHFPIAFPEVFLRERPGFDVIVGNPPWEKAHVEEHEFWCRHVPGFRGMTQKEREELYPELARKRPDLVDAFRHERQAADALRVCLMSGMYPGMGTGHPDLYKAFCWRFWNLVCDDGGRIGVVLPRSALAAKGSTEFRKEVFEHAGDVDITTLLNNRQWFFDDVHPQYTIGLVTLEKREAERTQVALRGPYPSLERYRGGMVREPAVFYGSDIGSWNDTASLPLLPTDASVEVFAQLRGSPRLDLDDGSSWRARPLQGDLNSTTGKPLMDFGEDCPEGFWPVYKGESFDLWSPDTGRYYAWADPEVVLPVLQQTRLRGGKNRRSVFSEFDPASLRDAKTLPCLGPRIAFRRISRATDTRTIRCALVPANVVLTDVAPYVLWPRGNNGGVAFLLGVLSSLALDWYSRRHVETHVDFHVFNPLPVPRPAPDAPLRLRVIELAGRLACPDERFATWAADVGVRCGPLDTDDKQDMIHELDAVVAYLYGLEEKHLRHVFETFHEGWDYEDRLRATRKHFRAWKRRAS